MGGSRLTPLYSAQDVDFWFSKENPSFVVSNTYICILTLTSVMTSNLATLLKILMEEWCQFITQVSVYSVQDVRSRFQMSWQSSVLYYWCFCFYSLIILLIESQQMKIEKSREFQDSRIVWWWDGGEWILCCPFAHANTISNVQNLIFGS